MTNQQLIFASVVAASTAFARNSELKKYRNTCVFLIGCDGASGAGCVLAGERQHLEHHLFSVMATAPEIAVFVKAALERAMAEPELAAKINSLDAARKGDDIINNVLGKQEE